MIALLLTVSVCSAQTLEEIVKKSLSANGVDQLEKTKTLYIEGKVSQMGMEMPMIMFMKHPEKVKVVITYNGMEIVTVFDGEKGYMINPLMGMAEPMELPADQVASVKNNNMFRNQLQESFKAGKLTLVGSEDVSGKPAFKLMVSVDGGAPVYYFIDKESFLTIKTTTTVTQMGQEMEVESVIKEYSDINGVKFPKLTISFVNGMEAGSTVLEKIELDKPIEDSVFTLK